MTMSSWLKPRVTSSWMMRATMGGGSAGFSQVCSMTPSPGRGARPGHAPPPFGEWPVEADREHPLPGARLPLDEPAGEQALAAAGRAAHAQPERRHLEVREDIGQRPRAAHVAAALLGLVRVDVGDELAGLGRRPTAFSARTR
jgi:hypothetical protein